MLHLAIAALIGGLAAIERKGALQLMLSRPIVLAPLLGAALGDVRGGLMLGMPLELLFLGGVNLGGSIPDNETLLAAALTCMVIPAGHGHTDAALAALGLGLLYPLALLGRSLERASERRNDALVEEALRRTVAGDPRGPRVNLRGLWLPALATGGICAACVLCAPLLGWARGLFTPRLVLGFEGSWHVLWALAAASAIRAIRDPRAPALAALSAAAVGAALLALGGLAP